MKESAISSAESAQFKSLPLEGKVSAKQTDEVYEKGGFLSLL